MDPSIFGGKARSHHIDISSEELDNLKIKLTNDALPILTSGSSGSMDHFTDPANDKLSDNIHAHNTTEDELEAVINQIITIETTNQDSLLNNPAIVEFADATKKEPQEIIHTGIESLGKKATSILNTINGTNQALPLELQDGHDTNLDPVLEATREKHRLASRPRLQKIYEWFRYN